MGTNCLGTCIISNVPIAVFGDQHFGRFKKWAGFGVPIHDSNHEILGALGIYVPSETANYNILRMLGLAAKGIENQIQLPV